ncbi:hypothetical protein CIB84_009567 [Bambusicola thoracicus]|uniref:Uncharacterized protein n=1 Tax=Bambusicola thoracicus TaxID=9083 RepID=A0A2P4SRF8_BAMTH|nr:hypothetical protein CIB84_009567 [Bambusicola thoracicus]
MLFIHFANVYLSDLTEEDPCSLYFINFLLDATLGMLLIYAGIRAVSIIVEWQQWESLRFGEYGKYFSFCTETLFKTEFLRMFQLTVS